MRVNVYAEEMTDNIEIISKTTPDGTFTGLRIYLYLPVTLASGEQVRGPFIHGPGDDDSAALTIWGKDDLRKTLYMVLGVLNEHYRERDQSSGIMAGDEPRIAIDARRNVYAEPCPHYFQDANGVKHTCELHRGHASAHGPRPPCDHKFIDSKTCLKCGWNPSL